MLNVGPYRELGVCCCFWFFIFSLSVFLLLLLSVCPANHLAISPRQHSSSKKHRTAKFKAKPNVLCSYLRLVLAHCKYDFFS